MKRIRVVGIGSPFGDDRAGWEVVARLRALAEVSRVALADVDFVQCGRPSGELVQLLADTRRVILVDAMQSGGTPGDVRSITTQQLDAKRSPALSSHGIGIAQAVRLAHSLGAQPTLEIFGIEVENVAQIDGALTPAVHHACGTLAVQIFNNIRGRAVAAHHRENVVTS